MMSKRRLAVEIIWSELLLCGGEWKSRKQIYDELIAEGYAKKYVDWYLFCLANHQPKEHDMDPKEGMRARIENDFTYHAPKGDQVERYQQLRDKAKELALLIVELTPVSREQSIALTELQTATMFANAAIACNE